MASINGYFGPVSTAPEKSLWGPLLKIALGTYPEPGKNQSITLLKNPVIALIDTGSMLCTISIDLAVELNLPRGVGGSITQLGHPLKSESYFASLYVPELPYWYAADLLGSPFKRDDAPFEVILGWDFLHRFNITLSSATGLVRLDFVG
jgi:hypothetical protein